MEKSCSEQQLWKLYAISYCLVQFRSPAPSATRSYSWVAGCPADKVYVDKCVKLNVDSNIRVLALFKNNAIITDFLIVRWFHENILAEAI